MWLHHPTAAVLLEMQHCPADTLGQEDCPGRAGVCRDRGRTCVIGPPRCCRSPPPGSAASSWRFGESDGESTTVENLGVASQGAGRLLEQSRWHTGKTCKSICTYEDMCCFCRKKVLDPDSEFATKGQQVSAQPEFSGFVKSHTHAGSSWTGWNCGSGHCMPEAHAFCKRIEVGWRSCRLGGNGQGL